MPTYQVRRRRCRRRRDQGTSRRRRARTRSATSCLLREPRGQADQAEEELQRDRDRRERVPRQEIMHFSRQMAAFVRAGIPITDALEVVEDGSGEQAVPGDPRRRCASRSSNGVPFSEALAEHSQVFPPYYIGILRSAELTGQLDTVLDQLSRLHRARPRGQAARSSRR